jgi:hypothetical protein
MSAVRDLLRQAAARVAGALNLSGSSRDAASAGRVSVDERNVHSESPEQERERELRTLMSNWM